ncbi:hypothetical protein LTR95_007661 [Oleoguttula sp. CCFEE 5521]
MASRTKLPASEEVEMSYNSHVRDIQRGNSTQGDGGIHERDEREIRRMGKLSQYKRVHRGRTIFATSASIQASWQVSLASLTPGLLNGRTAGIFWSFIFTAIFALSNVFSIAEYTSIAPINGGQYHWVSEFAPRYKKPLSYLTGWWSTIAWQSTAAGATFLAGSFIPSLAALFYPDYVPTPWQNNLCVFALVLLILAINATSTKPLIYIQMIAMVVLFIGWLPVAGCLAGLAPHPPFSETVTSFTSSGWSNLGIAVLVGQIGNVYALTSFDAAAHMAEEVSNAGRAVPLAIVWSYCGNAAVAFVVITLTMWSIPDVDAALDSSTGFPFIYALQQAGQRWAQAITAIIVLIAFAGCTGCNAAASREMAAFARDGGLPGSKWLAKVTKSTHPPRNSVYVTCLITAALTCINFGSTIAFNAIISGQLIALNASYALTHACALWARLTGKYRPEIARFNLGRYGPVANVVALCYDLFLIVFLAFPPAPEVDAASLNWGPLIFIVTTLFAGIYYVAIGRGLYRDPSKDIVG